MIEVEDVTLTYPGATAPVLDRVRLQVEPGELLLLVGGTGSGKSSLLGALHGRFPHSTGGELRGTVRIAGRDTREHRPRDLADVVGVVGQDVAATFVAGTVEDEIAYTLEQLGLPPATMRQRVEAVLDQLGLAPLRARALDSLSGGEQQRVAIGAVLSAHPQVLLLDEPTSALDPGAAEEVLAAVHRLVHDLGLTVVLAEHRVERVAQFADRVAVMADGEITVGLGADVLPGYPGAPPVTELGRVLGWTPLPITVREARRHAATATVELGPARPARPEPGPALLTATEVGVRHGATTAVERVDLAIHAGEVVALMGRNGAGKSSLLWALHGAGPRSGGQVRLTDGTETSSLDPAHTRSRIALLPQPAADLLYLDTVDAELAAGGAALAAPARALLDALAPGLSGDAHPRSLSEGQRLALAVAVQLAPEPGIALLDEPTRGLDAVAKQALADRLRTLATGGRAVVVATHDVEFAALCADRVVVMAQGEIVADGAAEQVLRASPMFAPQVAKVLPDAGVLTVAQVRERWRA